MNRIRREQVSNSRLASIAVALLTLCSWPMYASAHDLATILDGIRVTGVENPDLEPFDEMMVALMREHSVPGASLAVSRNGKLVYARGFGYRDVEQSKPVLPSTRFRIASISKPITAAAILILVQDGKLGLDDKLVSFLSPSERATVDPAIRSITIRHLLQHYGGWDRGKTFDPMFRAVQIGKELGIESPASQSQIIKYMLQRPLDYGPGTKYAYSNFGYCLLGRIIERVSEKPYGEFVQERLFAPLNIHSPVLARTLTPAAGETRYYTSDTRLVRGVVSGVIGKKVPSQYGGWSIENMDSHGGWIASAADLVAFADAFNNTASKRIVTRESVQEMFRAPPEDDESAVFYGLGWQVRRLAGNQKFNTWHTGSLPGTSTLLVRRHDGFNWAVLFNTRDGKDGTNPATVVDPLVHRAANRIEEWPEKGVSFK